MSDHVVESTFELSAFMKAGIMAGSERDSGSCSGADEDSRSGLHSPTVSEDSVDVQVTPISLRNKRKLAEPRKIQEPAVIATPLKKRRISPITEETSVDQEEARSRTPNHFRPWIPVTSKNEYKTTTTTSTVTTVTAATVSSTITTTTTTSTASSTKTSSVSERAEEEGGAEEQNEAMQRLHESVRRLQQSPNHGRSVFSSRREPRHKSFEPAVPTATTSTSPNVISLPHPRLQDEPLSLVVRDEVPRVPSHPAVSGTYEKTPSYMMEHLLASSQSNRNHQSHRSHQGHPMAVPASSGRHHHQGGQQRNYKNMTRERRIEANARERTRVHTISAAFDTLRRAIPAYSHNQKLSKLSVLRIACSYIMTLSKILEKDDEMASTRNNGLMDLGDCVESVSKTIQTEGKLRKRKDE